MLYLLPFFLLVDTSQRKQCLSAADAAAAAVFDLHKESAALDAFLARKVSKKERRMFQERKRERERICAAAACLLPYPSVSRLLCSRRRRVLERSRASSASILFSLSLFLSFASSMILVVRLLLACLQQIPNANPLASLPELIHATLCLRACMLDEDEGRASNPSSLPSLYPSHYRLFTIDSPAAASGARKQDG